MAQSGPSEPRIESQVRAIFEALGAGSLSEVARIMGWPERTARNWSRRGSIPMGRLVEIARRAGVPIARLEARPNVADHGGHRVREPPAYFGREREVEDAELLRLSDTAWPASVVRVAIEAVRSAEDEAAVLLPPALLADAVTIVVSTSALSRTPAVTVAKSVVGTYLQSGQVKRRGR